MNKKRKDNVTIAKGKKMPAKMREPTKEAKVAGPPPACTPQFNITPLLYVEVVASIELSPKPPHKDDMKPPEKTST
eukprot:3357272-Ditylum_brightwellii.AAC.1